jgi:hypothetical protein
MLLNDPFEGGHVSYLGGTDLLLLHTGVRGSFRLHEEEIKARG